MSKFATVVIPFAYTPKWGQIAISSLKKFSNEKDFDILLMNNTPHRDDVKAISETPLGKGVTVIETPRWNQWHGGALDHAIDLVETPYFFAMETDVTVDRHGWLDWYAGFMKDELVAMAGWFWMIAPDVNDGRHYINASATLYNTEILKILNQECKRNPFRPLVYGMEYDKRRYHDHFAELLDNKAIGPFGESRGFQHHNYPVPRPEKWSHEPGSWIFNRCSCQWECIKIPGSLVSQNVPNAPPDSHNYYGESDQEAYVRHYWGGTVSHNFEKHLVIVHYEAQQLDWWLTREHNLWMAYVPEDIRKYSIEKGFVHTLEDDLARARRQVHIIEPGMRVRIHRGFIISAITKDESEPEGGHDGIVSGWHHEHGLWMILLDEEPKDSFTWFNLLGEKQTQYKKDGKICVHVHPNQCMRI